MARRYSEQEIDEFVDAGQHARLDARLADPRWRLVEDDLTPIFGGGVWHYSEGED